MGKKYHAGMDEHVAGRAFSRRMMEARGIDPGPEGTAAPEANIYLKHVPTIDISAEPGKGIVRRVAAIAGWGVVIVAGLKFASFL
ncbi:hypothetical protein [Mesorhizobium sp. M0040]|uniref:hypothetical protein n=1 Tax=Mesorhizobium sp. M0040 TaxID=2956855 RepID=UPI00333D5DD6